MKQVWPIRCECGEMYPTIEHFRELPLDSAVSFDNGDKLAIRSCQCSRLLGVWLDRDGNPQQENATHDEETKTQD